MQHGSSGKNADTKKHKVVNGIKLISNSTLYQKIELIYIYITNEICGKSAITEPLAIEEVFAIRKKIPFHGGVQNIVIARIDTGVSEY